MKKLKLEPLEKVGSGKQGSITASYFDIVQAVGFADNVTHLDDPYKVKASWGFRDDEDREAFIWCFKHYGEKEDCTYWSTSGDKSLLNDIGLWK
tara:strand:+ start:532 stop:813 length:282 start_codon:yes stop_codon:yes gene_type:complete